MFSIAVYLPFLLATNSVFARFATANLTSFSVGALVVADTADNLIADH